MRTRRIAFGCRRTGSVAIAPSGPSLEALPVDLTWPPQLDLPPVPDGDVLPPSRPLLDDRLWHGDPVRHAALLRGDLPPIVNLPPLPTPDAPLPARVPGAARNTIPAPAPPPAGDRDLTLADLTTGRRDLSWNDNPGWPADIDWSAIARAARGHSPRHARRLSPRSFMWTGAGVITAILLTILITAISELLR